MSTIIVHSKPNCQPCRMSKLALERAGLAFTEVELTPESAEQFRAEGHAAAPIVVTPNATWAGFRPDLINGLS